MGKNNLYSAINNQTDFIAKLRIYINVAVTVNNLHKKGKIHNDLNWFNIRIGSDTDPLKAFLIDFGFAANKGMFYETYLTQAYRPYIDAIDKQKKYVQKLQVDSAPAFDSEQKKLVEMQKNLIPNLEKTIINVTDKNNDVWTWLPDNILGKKVSLEEAQKNKEYFWIGANAGYAIGYQVTEANDIYALSATINKLFLDEKRWPHLKRVISAIDHKDAAKLPGLDIIIAVLQFELANELYFKSVRTLNKSQEAADLLKEVLKLPDLQTRDTVLFNAASVLNQRIQRSLNPTYAPPATAADVKSTATVYSAPIGIGNAAMAAVANPQPASKTDAGIINAVIGAPTTAATMPLPTAAPK